MDTYCVSCNKNTANKNSSVRKQNRLMLLSNCAVSYKRISIFIKNQEPTILIIFEIINLI